MKKRVLSLICVAALGACARDSDVVSNNLSLAADQFELDRRVVFYNGITGSYMLTIEGRCALGNSDSSKRLTVVCKTGPTEFKKHFLGLSDNVTFFVEQLAPVSADVYRYRVVFKPDVIVPDISVSSQLTK